MNWCEQQGIYFTYFLKVLSDERSILSEQGSMFLKKQLSEQGGIILEQY